MPEIDRLESIKKLRTHGNLTPVIFLAAHGTDKVKEPDAGANDYLIPILWRAN